MAQKRDSGAGVSAARCYSLAFKDARQVTASEAAFRTDLASKSPALPTRVHPSVRVPAGNE
jgi:hypothetical protein